MSVKKIFLKSKIFYWLYKIQKIYKNKNPNFHFGEFGEDIFINRIFKNFKKGFYIDIGAYHPIKGSLTYLLYKRGWSGLNIDLSKVSIDLFNIARPHDINLNCAITTKNEETFFFENSEINQQNSLIKQNNKQIKKKILGRNLNSLLDDFKINDFQFLNIDTEGTEFDILTTINFEKYRPILLATENNSFDEGDQKRNKIINFMKEKNYNLVNIIGVTMFFIDSKFKNEINDFIKI